MATKKPNITLEDVENAVYQLSKNGEKASIRNVLAITGGSNGTISRYLAEVLDNEALQEQFNTIGKDLIKALMAEMKAITARETESIRANISSVLDLRKQVIDLLDNTEKQHEQQREEWVQQHSTLKDELQELKSTLDRTLAERDKLHSDLVELKDERRQLLEQVTDQAEQLAFVKGRTGYEDDRLNTLACRISDETQPPT